MTMIKDSMFSKILINTNQELINTGFLLLRFTIGIIIFVVGAGKVLGWFGGFGLTASINFYVSKMGISLPFAYLSCFTEFIGGILLAIGLFTRPAAFAIMINMLVATIKMLPNGFMGPGHASYPFIFLIIDIVILIAGPMHYSLDVLIMDKKS